MRSAQVSLVTMVLISGCSVGLPPEQFADAFAQAYCARQTRCEHLTTYVTALCETESKYQIAPGDVPAALASGRVIYDAMQAQRCVDLVEQTSCLADLPLSDQALAACYAAVRGTVATGDTCHSFFECEKGLCTVDSGSSCPGVCPQTLGEGEACSLVAVDGPACDERQGLICSPGAGVCVKPAGPQAPCADDFGCRGGLVCVAGTCQSLRTEGQGCSGDSACAEGLACVGGSDEGGGHCEKRLAEGEACASDPDDLGPALRNAQCQEALLCKGAGLTDQGDTISGICSKPSGLGGDCLVEAPGMQLQVSGCDEGLICVDGTCQLPPTSGPCAPHDTCKSDVSWCNPDGNCSALKPDGAPCDIPPECEGGACVNNVCTHDVVFCRAE